MHYEGLVDLWILVNDVIFLKGIICNDKRKFEFENYRAFFERDIFMKEKEKDFYYSNW